MEKAKAAIKDFTSKAGHHDTTVHETVDPAVKHETVKPTRHENVNTAIDKEVHQDHYHRTVQPVHDKEVLPEKHTHNLGAVEHRDFDHRDHEHTKKTLAAETQQFQDQQVVHDTHHTKSNAPVVQGEHVHHHLHETIQPVVHKETIQPNVVHTTVPIHETHHNAAQHHATTTLPPVNMGEYKKSGGVLGGREERFDAFEGKGTGINDHLSHQNRKEGINHDQPPKGVHHGDFDHSHSQSRTGVSSGTGTHQSGTGIGSGTGAHQSGTGIGSGTGAHQSGTGIGSGTGAHQSGAGVASGTGAHQHTTNDAPKKASLLDKLNPMVDSNGDGKAGFMK